MSEKTSSRSREVIEERLGAIAEAVGRDSPQYPAPQQTPEDQHQHLLEEAQELYSNELAWEAESGEESTGSGAVVELVFPGTLALVDALLTSHDRGEKGEGGQHRDVVSSLLDWLANRLFELRSGQSGGSATDRAKRIDMTDQLIDLVLYRYCGLDEEEVEKLQASRN